MELPVEVKTTIYRIVQEAFNNIAKHADATRVGLSLQARGDGFELAIQDNGQGFDPQAVSEDKLGLQIMGERAAEIEARLEVHSALGQRTRLVLIWK